MNDEEKTFWQENPELATKYSSPLDRNLYCDQRLIQVLDIQPNDSVLDIGSSSGDLTVQLAEHASKVVGIDSSEAMLQQAQKLAYL
jgi:ubiquinone/menaquinone biosynthesis C-methylase UbiE